MSVDPTKITDPPTPPTGGNPPSPTPTPPAPQQKTPLDTLPEDVQTYIKELRGEAEAARLKSQQEAARLKADAAEKMKQQGQFEELAKQHEARVKELEPKADALNTLSEQVIDLISEITKEWPTDLKAFDPGKSAGVDQRLAWLRKGYGLLPEVTARQRAGSPGAAPGPRAAKATTAQENMDLLLQQGRAAGKHRAF